MRQLFTALTLAIVVGALPTPPREQPAAEEAADLVAFAFSDSDVDVDLAD